MSYVDKLAKFLEGKITLLIGEAWSGKTYLCCNLAEKFDRTFFINIDQNFNKRDYPNYKKITYYDVNNLAELINQLKYLTGVKGRNLVVVDSLTIAEDWIKHKKIGELTDKTILKYMAGLSKATKDSFYDLIFDLLSNIKRYGSTIITTAQIPKGTGNILELKKVKVLVGDRFLRRVQTVIWIYEKDNKRVISCIADRSKGKAEEVELVGF